MGLVRTALFLWEVALKFHPHVVGGRRAARALIVNLLQLRITYKDSPSRVIVQTGLAHLCDIALIAYGGGQGNSTVGSTTSWARPQQCVSEECFLSRSSKPAGSTGHSFLSALDCGCDRCLQLSPLFLLKRCPHY